MKQDGRSRSGRGQNGEIADKRVVVGRVQRQVRRAFVARVYLQVAQLGECHAEKGRDLRPRVD